MAKDININVKINGIGNAKDQLEDAIHDIENNPIEIPVEVKTEGSIAELKRLKNELKKADVGSEAFKELFGQIDDLEDKIKGAKQVSSDWIDTLENSGGVLGSVGKGLNGLKVQFSTLGGAIKATGVGLLITLLGGLVGAFKENEGAMKKIQPLLDGVSKLFQGIFRVVEPLFNILVDLALKALPLVTDAIGSVYSVVSAVVESFGALGKAISKLVKGDFSGAWNEAKKSVTDFSTHYEESKNRFIGGTQEMTKHEKEEAEKRAEARKKEQERLDKLNAERAKKAKEQADALAKIEKEKQDQIRRFAEEAQEAENKILAEIASAKKENANLDKTEREKLIIAENEKYAKLIEQAKAFGLSTEELEIQHLNKINQINLDASDKQKAIDDKLIEDKKKLQDEQDKADKLIAENKQKAIEQNLAITSDSLSKASELVGESTATGKGLAVAGTLISTYSTAQKAYESAFLPVPTVFSPALGAVSAGIAVAAGLANVKKILAIKTPKGGGGSAGVPSSSSTPLTPQTNLVGNATNLNSTTATPVNGQQNTFTVKAYVSETDITNSQNFISKVKSSAEI